MSVLIKGMDMPTDCGKCFVGDRSICKDGCPIEEVPTPHGRLIDADELIRMAKKWVDHPDPYISQRNKDFIYFLEKEDAVIEAEE